MNGDGWVGMGGDRVSSDWEKLIPTPNPSPSLGIKFIPITT